jgi:ribosomal protein S18 acetylase RimI-like enzyme
MEILPYAREHLEPILTLSDGVAFSSLVADPERADRALSSPGAVALVAVEEGEVIGFAHTITDGAVQAYLCMLLVAPAHQRRGVGRALVEESLARSGAIRMDLISTEEAEPFYRGFPHNRWPGFRLYPDGPPGERPS